MTAMRAADGMQLSPAGAAAGETAHPPPGVLALAYFLGFRFAGQGLGIDVRAQPGYSPDRQSCQQEVPQGRPEHRPVLVPRSLLLTSMQEACHDRKVAP